MYRKYDIEKMKELKRRGYSQSEISNLTGASKQLVSYHTKSIVTPGDSGLCTCIYCKSPKAKLHYRKGYRGEIVYVGCSNCHARGPDSLDIEGAVNSWNAVNK